MTRVLAMMSGGLDSTLAAKLIKDQGIEVIAVCFKSHFFDESNAKTMCQQIGIQLEVVDITEEHLEMVRDPKHGYGKNMNPCIDCHAMMARITGQLLEKFNADFIITGEVLNQRPMSQNMTSLEIVKNESGYSERILRPLSAKNLPPTKMELEGLVKRENLLDFSGRTRKPQMELAKKWGIKDYPSPAGGCKLTEPNYSRRLEELLKNHNNLEAREISLLKLGRHFRVSDKSVIISTRTNEEAQQIKEFLNEKDIIMFAEEFNGSMVVIVGEPTEEDMKFAAAVAAKYSKGRDQEIVKIKYGYYKSPLDKKMEESPATDGDIQGHIL